MWGDGGSTGVADTNEVGDGQSILHDHFGRWTVLGLRSEHSLFTSNALYLLKDSDARLNKSDKPFTVENSSVDFDSKDVLHDADRHRDASENNIKSPKSGTCNAVRTENNTFTKHSREFIQVRQSIYGRQWYL